MSKHKEKCGCTHDGARWLSECAAHKAEGDALHARAMREHKRGPVSPTAGAPESDWLDVPKSARHRK